MSTRSRKARPTIRRMPQSWVEEQRNGSAFTSGLILLGLKIKPKDIYDVKLFYDRKSGSGYSVIIQKTF